MSGAQWFCVGISAGMVLTAIVILARRVHFHTWAQWERVQVNYTDDGKRLGSTTKQARQCKKCGRQKIKAFA